MNSIFEVFEFFLETLFPRSKNPAMLYAQPALIAITPHTNILLTSHNPRV
ncbi:hypothetical protein [Echinicola pacifica]|nr:hypothetical protein [Echinicola pacifica]